MCACIALGDRRMIGCFNDVRGECGCLRVSLCLCVRACVWQVKLMDGSERRGLVVTVDPQTGAVAIFVQVWCVTPIRMLANMRDAPSKYVHGRAHPLHSQASPICIHTRTDD